jgi:hypothetical protein
MGPAKPESLRSSQNGGANADYSPLSVNLDIPIEGFQWLGASVELDEIKDKNWYFGLGPQLGKSMTEFSASLTNGFIAGKGIATSSETDNFVKGWTVNGLAGFGKAVGVTWSPYSTFPRNFAFESGVATPQIGIGASDAFPLNFNF